MEILNRARDFDELTARLAMPLRLSLMVPISNRNIQIFDDNIIDLIKHLASINYSGPVSPSASSQSYKGQTRESIVQRAQEAVDGISKEAGLTVAPLPMELIEDIPYEPNPMG